MSGTKFNVKYKDLKTEVETDLEGLQELPIKFKQLSTNAPKTLGVYVTENSTVLTNLDDNDKLLDSVVTPASLVYARVDSENVTNGAVDLHASSTIHTSYLSINKGNNDPYVLMGVNGDTDGSTSIRVEKQEFHLSCANDDGSVETTLKVVPTGITITGDVTVDTGDVSAVDITASGNVSAVGITATGDMSAVGITATEDMSAVGITATGNVSAVDITATGNLKANTISPETGNQVVVTNLNEAAGGDIHLTLIDAANATSKIDLIEGWLPNTIWGGRLSYSGRDTGTENTQGTGLVALSSISNDSGVVNQKDILSYTYQGKDVKLESQEHIFIESKVGSSEIKTESTSQTTITSTGTNGGTSKIELAATGASGVVAFTATDKVEFDSSRVLMDATDGIIQLKMTNSYTAPNKSVDIQLDEGTQDAFGTPSITLDASDGVLLLKGEVVCDNANGTTNAFTIRNMDIEIGDSSDASENSTFSVTTDDIFFTNLPEDTVNSFDTNIIGVRSNTKKLYLDADGAFFSGTHVYPAEEVFPLGASIELRNGVAYKTSSPNSTICVGVVAASAPTEGVTSHSLATIDPNIPPSHIVRVVGVGDSRMKNLNGFHVCNENGAVAPGDLLVTSSKAGYLMRQQDDIIRASTVGKAMDTAVFDGEGNATGVYGFLYCG